MDFRHFSESECDFPEEKWQKNLAVLSEKEGPEKLQALRSLINFDAKDYLQERHGNGNVIFSELEHQFNLIIGSDLEVALDTFNREPKGNKEIRSQIVEHTMNILKGILKFCYKKGTENESRHYGKLVFRFIEYLVVQKYPFTSLALKQFDSCMFWYTRDLKSKTDLEGVINDITKTEEVFEKSLKGKTPPQFSYLALSKGKLFEKLEQKDKAVNEYKKSIRISKKTMFEEMKKKHKHNFDKVQFLSDFKEPNTALFEMYQKYGQYKAASKVYHGYLDTMSSLRRHMSADSAFDLLDQPRFELAKCYHQLEYFREAKKLLKNAISTQCGEFTPAFNEYEKSLKNDWGAGLAVFLPRTFDNFALFELYKKWDLAATPTNLKLKKWMELLTIFRPVPVSHPF